MSTQSGSNTNQNSAKSRFGSSRFGSSSSGGRSSSSSQSSSRFSNLSRFSRQSVQWTVQPFFDTAVRISLDGLGDPFHRLLGRPLNDDYSDAEAIAAALQDDVSLHDELVEVLDRAWETYGFEGTAMMYPWNTEIYTAYTKPIYPLLPVDSDEDDDNQNQQSPEDLYESPFTCLRAIDVGLVLNVLARIRANVLVLGTPLALEEAFLKQTYVCDDPRIVSIVRATGSMKEEWE